jgi:ATP-binding cassette subfamily B multidrug efflux pump
VSALEHYLETEEKEGREVRTDSFRRIVRQIFGHSGLFFGGMGLTLLGSAAYLLEPLILGWVIDHALAPRDWEKLKWLTLAFLATQCVRVAALIGQGWLFEKLGQRVMQELRMQLVGHLQRLPVAIFDKNPVGRLVTRVSNDISSLAEMFSSGAISMVDNLLRVLGTLIFLFLLDVRLALAAACVFPVLVGFTWFFTLRLRVCYREARSKMSALNAFLAENILGMRVVNLFNRQKLHLERFQQVNQGYTDATVRTVRIYAFFQPTITWLSGVSMAVVIVYGGWRVSEGSLSLGALVAFFAYVQALFQPVREIADKWNIFLSGMASAERIHSILDWDPEPGLDRADSPASPIEGLRGHIVFENVWFAYQDERWVLKDFSLEILPGQRIGVVGHTGAGKTTLISLLLRFYEPQRGQILVDGRDIREYDKRRLRASIGLVQQDVFLFSGSVKDNLTLWRGLLPRAREQVARVLADLGLSRWLDESTGELSLGERGNNLSMGERQVLAFVRALASGPALWILDEATANIDSSTERKLGRALDEASRGRTTLMIAHRLATVRDADRILVLHHGQLLESGKHSELMALGGLYARLYRYQSAVAQQQEHHQMLPKAQETVLTEA